MKLNWNQRTKRDDDMALSEEQIKELLEWFMTSSESRRKYSEPRRRAYEKNHRWIQPVAIRNMPDDELGRRFLEYYKSGGARQNLVQISRNRIIRDKKRFREAVLFLLDENVDVKERMDKVLKGEHRIEGFGKAIATSFLMDFDLEQYCLWNNKTEMGFTVLGWNPYSSKDSPGTAYLKVLDALRKLKGLGPEFNVTFDDIDLFLHTISAEDEGKQAVTRLTQGPPISPPPVGEECKHRSLTIRAKVPWDKLSEVIRGVIRPLREKGLIPEITIEIKGESREGFDSSNLHPKIKETLQQIGAKIERWEEG